MIQSELIEDGFRIRHWSDAGFKIRQIETGIVYDDAVDYMPCKYTYEETEEPLETEEETHNEEPEIHFAGVPAPHYLA